MDYSGMMQKICAYFYEILKKRLYRNVYVCIHAYGFTFDSEYLQHGKIDYNRSRLQKKYQILK